MNSKPEQVDIRRVVQIQKDTWTHTIHQHVFDEWDAVIPRV